MKSALDQGIEYDLALLDMMMPDINGFELASMIKADPSLSGIRLVMLTSAGQRGDGERARNSGIAGYLTKPVRQSQLFDCLVTVMGTTQLSSHSSATESNVKVVPKLITTHSLREAARASGKLILVAEDNMVNQKVALHQLHKLGYRADAVANGLEALEALSRIPYDLVFMDCQMPEMDGFEATAEVRRREGDGKHTPIVAMTAHALIGDYENSIAAGMDDHITKPVGLDNLGKVLDKFFHVPSGPVIAPQRPDASAVQR